nr:unnamed protein product [Spirometra erinaceieuropaei]
MLLPTVLLVALLIVNSATADDNCQKEGEACSKTIFQRCCDQLVCDLAWFGNGKCVKCLPQQSICWFDSDCCSGQCSWFRCE